MKSNAKLKVTQKEVEKSIEITIPNEEANDVTAGILKNNHLRNLYANFCILNQEFLSYVVSCNLSQAQLNLLFFLMSEMDKENRIFINNQVIMTKLKLSEPTTITAIKKLTAKKIIVKQKLGVSKYEIQINHNILNPLLAFKNKANKENVKSHKALIKQEEPYSKQTNIYGGIDFINGETGEIFHTIQQENISNHKIGTIPAPKQIEIKNNTDDIFEFDVIEDKTEEDYEKLKNQFLIEIEKIRQKRKELEEAENIILEKYQI